MMTRTLLARCAPLAIAASAALPVMPAVAQDASASPPVIVLPDTDVAPVNADPAPAPTIVLPAPAPVVATPVQTTNAPTTERVTATSEPAPARARSSSTRTGSVGATRGVVTSAPEVAPARLAANISPERTTLPMTSSSAETEVMPGVAQPVSRTNADGTDEALVAGMLGALGLAAVGGVAFAASRRRRRRATETDYDVVEPNDLEEPVAAEPVVVRNPEPTPAMPMVPASSFAAAAPAPVMAPPAAPMASTTSVPNGDGDPIPLPSQVPETFEERDALLKELVAAEPDRANPFTSVRARARRAKLIMQSLGQDFQSRKPRIDLSEYTNRWPALRGWQPATA